MTDQTRIANRYRLERRIGSGSMGVVWQAVDELLGRSVAMKELLAGPEPTGGKVDSGEKHPGPDEAQARMLREGRLAARLQHPHTISVFDVVLHEDRPWLVMEYLPSLSLARVLTDGGPLPPLEVASVGEQIADGLAAAHAAGIVHRDVKPGNVLITEDGTVKLSDFGVSWAADDVAITRTGLIQGTPAFLAPEVARGQPPTAASDVFALGATLYTAVEGEPPFGLSDNTFAQLHTVANGKVRPPSQAGPLTAVLMRLLRADPAERPTASEARTALAAIANGRASLPERLAGLGVDGHRAASTPGRLVGTAPLPMEPLPMEPLSGAPQHGAPRSKAPRSKRSDGAHVRAESPDRSGQAVAAMPPVRRRRRRGSLITVLAVVLGLLVVSGATTLVVLAANSGSPQVTASAPASAPRSAVPTGQPSAAEMVAFIEQYYALLPEDTEAAFALLGPEAQRLSNGREGFRTFYAQMADVRIADGPRAVGNDLVQATIEFVDKAGLTNSTRYVFTVRRDADGRLQMVTFR